jgi:hypothetical protein
VARGRRGLLVALVLVASAVTVGLAPRLMPDSYSWITHTTSESAAQGVDGAWLARLGLLLFGLAVLGLCVVAHRRWSGLATLMHATFGVLMVAAAAFSARSWEAGASFDGVEDLLHSVAATAMGFAFAFGVLAVATGGWRHRGLLRRSLDVLAVAASVVVPLSMMAVPDLAGVLQRSMFVIAYLWYLGESFDRRSRGWR